MGNDNERKHDPAENRENSQGHPFDNAKTGGGETTVGLTGDQGTVLAAIETGVHVTNVKSAIITRLTGNCPLDTSDRRPGIVDGRRATQTQTA